MPRKKAQFEEIRQKSKLKIKETALELFATNGYHNTSISKIAKVAGVSKGLMYNYYESKEALLDEILFGVVNQKQSAAQGILMKEIPPKQRLELIIEGMFAMVQSNSSYWKLMMSLSLQDEISERIDAKFAAQRSEGMQQYVDLFEAMEVEQPLLAAYFFGSSLTGCLLQYVNLKGAYPIVEMKNYLIEKFCR